MAEREGYDRLSPFLKYLAVEAKDQERLPSLAAIGQELGVSLATLREQLEVARSFGLVEVKPKIGVRRLQYTFSPAVVESVTYATAVDERYFQQFSELRNHIEAAYWYEAVSLLREEDHATMLGLVERAEERLGRKPVQIPHTEHRQLHLTIYCRLNNAFVTGILEAYWEIYETVGLNLYTDYSYLQNVWRYHRKMVEAICAGNLDAGYSALNEHTHLLKERANRTSRQKFE